MTFLCGPDARSDVAHSEYSPGKWGWPKPWKIRCDDCLFEFAYAALARGHVKQVGPDRHQCDVCAAAAPGQLRLEVESGG